MTNPSLSISTTKSIGRLYQLPTGSYTSSISSTAARRGLYVTGDLFPSITNVLGVLNKNLEGYAIYMMGKALREGQDIANASKAPDVFRDHAAARGSAVHLLVEQYINAGNGKRGMFLPAFKSLAGWPDVQELGGEGYMRGFIKFANDYKPEFIQQESTVFGSTLEIEEGSPLRFMQRAGQPLVRSSPRSGPLNYAGTTDFIARIGGVKVVGDWKCTSKLHGTVARQMAAVRNATHYHNTETNELDEWDGQSIEQAIAVRLCSDGTYQVQAANIEAGWESFKNLRAEWDSWAFGDSGLLRDLNPLELYSS